MSIQIQGVAMAEQQKTQRRRRSAKPLETRADYTAAVRYHDGRSDLFHIKNASDMIDARTIVMGQLLGVQTVMIALRRPDLPE
jgi:hypothetical protein